MGLGLEVGKGGAGSIVGTVLGMATAKWQDRRQLKQQGKLNEQQLGTNKQMAEYNQQLGLDMWNKTNYKAQVDQLKKAGLNVGLMYEGGGAGGTTQTAGGSVNAAGANSGGGEVQAGMGMGLGLIDTLAKANLANSQANLANTIERKTSGVDTENVKANTENTQADTVNKAISGNILQYEERLKNIELKTKDQTLDETIAEIKAESRKAIAEAKTAENESKISNATVDEKIKQIKGATVEQGIRIALGKVGIERNEQEIRSLRQDIEMKWDNWSQREKEIFIKTRMLGLQGEQTEFNTNAAAQMKQMLSAINELK